MSNKLNINRDRLFTQGYRKYLQSLTHGALVDFVLRGGDLAFTPAQERELLLDQIADEQKRHDRATKKINELVHENRSLRQALEAKQPVDTAASEFIKSIGDYHNLFEGLTSMTIVNADTNEVIFDLNSGKAPSDEALELIKAIIEGTPASNPIETPEDYVEAYPESVNTSTLSCVTPNPLPDDILDACVRLESAFQPFSTVQQLAPGVGLMSVLIQFRDVTVANEFGAAAEAAGVSPMAYGQYVVNHAN